MFLNPNILKRIMKEQFKTSGLTIANNGETIYMGGEWWGIEALREFIPNKIKAAIVEMAGEFPQTGDTVNVTKEGGQLELEFNSRIHIESDVREIYKTRLIVYSKNGTALRILQDDKNKVILIKNLFIGMIDNSQIDYGEGETGADGPYYKSGAIYWQNNVCKMRVYKHPVEKEMEEIIEAFERIDLLSAGTVD